MKQLLIISGKGGTGKTSLVSAFSSLADEKVISDCDVDAADLHLVLDPEIESKEEFYGDKEAIKDDEKCTDCGICREYCRFDAIDENFEIDPYRCEGCGVCVHVCPEDAIRMEDTLSGYFYESETEFGKLVHGELKAGEETSGKLVTEIKERAVDVAEREGEEIILIDGSPGTGCPVIASIADVDLALVVTEPTLSGLNDLKRVIQLSENFEIEPAVVVNKYDLNGGMVERIESYAEDKGVPILGKVPYDPQVTEAMVRGKSIVEYSDEGAAAEIVEIWKKLEKRFESIPA